MTEQWFRFSVPGAEDRYGYGTQAEADEFCKLLGHAYCADPLEAHPRLRRKTFSAADILALLLALPWQPKRSVQ